MEVVFGVMMISIGKTTFMTRGMPTGSSGRAGHCPGRRWPGPLCWPPIWLDIRCQRRLLGPSAGFRRVPLNANASRPTPLRLHVGVFGVIKRVRRRGSVNAAATTIAPIALRGRPRNPNDLHSKQWSGISLRCKNMCRRVRNLCNGEHERWRRSGFQHARCMSDPT